MVYLWIDVTCVFYCLMAYFSIQRDKLKKRLTASHDALEDWRDSWLNENHRRLAAQRESESWKTRCFEMSQSAALQANVDFVRIKNLEAQIRALQIKRAHKKGGK